MAIGVTRLAGVGAGHRTGGDGGKYGVGPAGLGAGASTARRSGRPDADHRPHHVRPSAAALLPAAVPQRPLPHGAGRRHHDGLALSGARGRIPPAIRSGVHVDPTATNCTTAFARPRHRRCRLQKSPWWLVSSPWPPLADRVRADRIVAIDADTGERHPYWAGWAPDLHIAPVRPAGPNSMPGRAAGLVVIVDGATGNPFPDQGQLATACASTPRSRTGGTTWRICSAPLRRLRLPKAKPCSAVGLHRRQRRACLSRPLAMRDDAFERPGGGAVAHGQPRPPERRHRP